jgi:hypothetical protein
MVMMKNSKERIDMLLRKGTARFSIKCPNQYNLPLRRVKKGWTCYNCPDKETCQHRQQKE